MLLAVVGANGADQGDEGSRLGRADVLEHFLSSSIFSCPSHVCT